MDYFVIGAANYAENSNKHAADIPAGSLKYFWAELLKLGGFAYFEATPANMTFKFIDGDRKQLYETVMLPRKWYLNKPIKRFNICVLKIMNVVSIYKFAYEFDKSHFLTS